MTMPDNYPPERPRMPERLNGHSAIASYITADLQTQVTYRSFDGMLPQRAVEIVTEAALRVDPAIIAQDMAHLQESVATALNTGELILPRMADVSAPHDLAEIALQMVHASMEVGVSDALAIVSAPKLAEVASSAQVAIDIPIEEEAKEFERHEEIQTLKARINRLVELIDRQGMPEVAVAAHKIATSSLRVIPNYVVGAQPAADDTGETIESELALAHAS